MVLFVSSIDDLPTRLYHIRSKEAVYEGYIDLGVNSL